MRKRKSGATYKARKLRRENWIVGGENEVNDPHGDTRFRNVLPIQYVKMLFGGSSFVEVKERNNLTKSYKHMDLRAARPVVRKKLKVCITLGHRSFYFGESSTALGLKGLYVVEIFCVNLSENGR